MCMWILGPEDAPDPLSSLPLRSVAFSHCFAFSAHTDFEDGLAQEGHPCEIRLVTNYKR